MRLLFAGTPEVALPSFKALLDSSHEVVAVLTRPDSPSGRKRLLTASPVKEAAEAAGIEVLTPARASEPALAARIVELGVEAAPVVAYGGLIPPALLALPPQGWINLHFSLLPTWRGAAPVQRAIMAGDELTGATTFMLEEGLDTGPTVGLLTERLRPDDTAGAVLDRLSHAGAKLLLDSLDAIEAGTAVVQDQAGMGVSHAPKLTSADAQVNWARPAYAVDRQVRGCTPSPGAHTTFRGQRLKIYPVVPLLGRDEHSGEAADAAPLAPGELGASRTEVLVGTGRGSVRLSQVQPPGKQPMLAADWARGAHLQAGDALGEGN